MVFFLSFLPIKNAFFHISIEKHKRNTFQNPTRVLNKTLGTMTRFYKIFIDLFKIFIIYHNLIIATPFGHIILVYLKLLPKIHEVTIHILEDNQGKWAIKAGPHILIISFIP